LERILKESNILCFVDAEQNLKVSSYQSLGRLIYKCKLDSSNQPEVSENRWGRGNQISMNTQYGYFIFFQRPNQQTDWLVKH
jgi:hypothetical protein